MTVKPVELRHIVIEQRSGYADPRIRGEKVKVQTSCGRFYVVKYDDIEDLAPTCLWCPSGSRMPW